MIVSIYDFGCGVGDSCLIPLQFNLVSQTTNPDGTVTSTTGPMDISGYQFAFNYFALLSRNPCGPAGFQPPVTTQPPLLWTEVITAAAGKTIIPITSGYTSTILPATYSYDCKWKSPLGIINTILKGRFTLSPSPTGSF